MFSCQHYPVECVVIVFFVDDLVMTPYSCECLLKTSGVIKPGDDGSVLAVSKVNKRMCNSLK